ncbi:MAG TPA: hypothetical protein VMC09_05700 [Anaerolineales bacterium]|nr:hypothetical protein [Anaerolineales bacterium]
MPAPLSTQPFWKEEPDFSPSAQKTFHNLTGLIAIYRFIFAFLIYGSVFFLFYFFSPILAGVWLLLILLLYSLGYSSRRRRKLALRSIADTQQRAHDSTGASLIGSAVHVAGHPGLEREQKVVIALASPNLALYSYESDQPIVVIPLQKITAVQTVVYDDERVPHVDVVDSSAQAIQLVIQYGKQEVACLFRRMKRVRPVDWYHAIQKARIQGNNDAG